MKIHGMLCVASLLSASICSMIAEGAEDSGAGGEPGDAHFQKASSLVESTEVETVETQGESDDVDDAADEASTEGVESDDDDDDSDDD